MGIYATVMYEWGDGERVVAKIVRVRGREATSDQAGGRATRQGKWWRGLGMRLRLPLCEGGGGGSGGHRYKTRLLDQR